MKYRHRVLTLLFLLSIITYIDRVCISVAGPRIQADLGITPDQWGWVVGVFAIAYAAFEIPSGAMGDRIGLRKVLTPIVLWWSAGALHDGFEKDSGVRAIMGSWTSLEDDDTVSQSAMAHFTPS
jgi:MFS family permease